MDRPRLLRPILAADEADVLRLNEAHVELLSPMDAVRLRQLRTWSSRADVIVCDDQTAGFVLVFGPGTPYDSQNYRWFCAAFGADFEYLDRIVIDDRFRRRGLATAVYDELEQAAAARGRLALEVNVDPPNDPSLAFHRGRGYEEIAQLGAAGHRVSLMAKAISDKSTRGIVAFPG